MDRGAGRPSRDVVERRRGAEPTRDQRANDLPDRQDRARAAREGPPKDLLHSELAQEMLDQKQRPDAAARPGHRRIQTSERPGERLELPGDLQRILTPQVCHNTMADLALLVAVPLDQLQVAVLAA